MKREILAGKGKTWENFQRALKDVRNSGEIWNGGKCIIVYGGMDTPGTDSLLSLKLSWLEDTIPLEMNFYHSGV